MVDADPANPRAPEVAAADLDSPELETLYAHPLVATRTGPLYNAFSYPTKISPETVALYIATHTNPGETVLDAFAGSGTTGLAAMLCDRPTAAMLAQAREAGLEPVWGPRNVVLYELGVLGAFIAQTMCKPPDARRFRAAAEGLLATVRSSHGWIYGAEDDAGRLGELRHVIWSDVLVCARCSQTTTYWDARVRFSPLRLEQAFACRHCGVRVRVDECERAVVRGRDATLGASMQRRERLPVMVYGTGEAGRWRRPATDADRELADRVALQPLSAAAPRTEVRWGDLHRSGYHFGITHLHHFYTPRNFLAIDVLWSAIEQQAPDLQDALRLLVLSVNATHATNMTRVVVKRGQADFVLTSAQSGVLYVSGLPVEKNVFKGVERKIGTLATAFSLVAGSASRVRVVNASSTELDLADGSVDYVFTDPPFGANIPYAELAQLNEAWLGRSTDREQEAIVSRGQGKSMADYEQLLTRVFREVERVMADDAAATLIFHSARASVWRALTESLARAGLSVRRTSILDKVQASFKQTVSRGSVKGDAAIMLVKNALAGRCVGAQPRSVDEVVASVVRAAVGSRSGQERSRERMFSRFVAACLTEGVPLTVDAARFYELSVVQEAAR
jgi:16S rRNA G966 N2-methylase RsmD